MTCEKYQIWLKDQVAGELSAEHRRKLIHHLQSCPSCRMEKKLLGRTVGVLTSLEEEPVAQHFFVYEAERRSLRELWTGLSWGARSILGVASALVLVLATLIVLGGSVSYQDGRVVAAFGGTAETFFDREEFMREVVDTAAEVSRREGDRWLKLARDEFQSVADGLDDARSNVLREALAELESRIDRRHRLQMAGLQEGIQDSMTGLYRSWYERRAKDLDEINQEFGRVAANDQLQSSQMETMVATLLDLSSVRSQ